MYREDQIYCPTCGNLCSITSEQLGKHIDCPACKQSFAVPPPPPQSKPLDPPPPSQSQPSPITSQVDAFKKSLNEAATKITPAAKSAFDRFQVLTKHLTQLQKTFWLVIASLHGMMFLFQLFMLVVSIAQGPKVMISVLIGIPIFQLLFLVYLLPTHVAVYRNHASSAAIFVINFLLGWVCLGYIVALAWCVSFDPGKQPPQR